MTARFNGVDGSSGQPLPPQFDLADLGSRLRGSGSKPLVDGGAVALPFGRRWERIEEAGWALVCPAEEAPELQRALEPLLALRRRTVQPRLLRHRQGESAAEWLARHGVGQGSVLPDRVPGYLLIAGSPERIPFEFSQDLDVEYAVGRLHFDSYSDYAAYAESLAKPVAQFDRSRAAFFAPRHALDPATQLSSRLLAEPLAAQFGSGAIADQALADRATKARLAELLAHPPALLFTASHGLGWPNGHAKQRHWQGALLCQDWVPFQPVAESHAFGASDVNSRLHGMVAFLFACYGLATPRQDSFSWTTAPDIAPAAFFSDLPKRMLLSGAGAVIGHLDRAWGFSMESPGAGAQIQPFRNCVARLLAGEPVGAAVRDFQERYASLSVTFVNLLRRASAGVEVSDREIAARWIERNDAGGYAIFGDPAVCLVSTAGKGRCD